jgi:hypothetical protein
MDVFDLRRNLVDSYSNYIRSFIQIRDDRISAKVEEELKSGLLWPEPLIQLNLSFQSERTIDEPITEIILYSDSVDAECITTIKSGVRGERRRSHRHQGVGYLR